MNENPQNQTPANGPADVTGHPITATGRNGTITVDGDRVTIRKGLVSRSFGVRGHRQVLLRDVTAVRMQAPTEEDDGYLQLVLRGDTTPTGALLAPSSGEHTIAFDETSAAEFEQVRAHVQSLLDARSGGTQEAA